MIAVLFACAVALQQGSPTTPIVQPKPPAKKSAPAHKKPATKPKTKKIVVGEKQARKQSPVVVKPYFVDKRAGSGSPVLVGDVVTIHFLVQRRNGQDLADSKKRGLPYTFKVGAKGNDPLLDMVVKGMKAGGTRMATIAAKDVYGPAGAPPVISGQDTLVVTITLLRRGEK